MIVLRLWRSVDSLALASDVLVAAAVDLLLAAVEAAFPPVVLVLLNILAAAEVASEGP